MKDKLLVWVGALCVASVAHAGGRSDGPNLMDRFLENNSSKEVVSKKRSRLLLSGPDEANTVSTNSKAKTAECSIAESISPAGNSLVFHDAMLRDSFSFDGVLEKIVTTSPGFDSVSSELLLEKKNHLINSLLASFNRTEAMNGDVEMSLDKRPLEAALNSDGDFIRKMKPLGLFNRFDLASESGNHCGEYRVAFGGELNSGRFFVIFEAQYPNPQPAQGLAGCAPVVDFWASLDALSSEAALAKLQSFYMNGIDHKGVSLPAAIDFDHFSAGHGQVRVNAFVTRVWQLREFRTGLDESGVDTEFTVDTVKSNPLAELYKSQGSVTKNQQAADTLRDDFRSDFLLDMLPQLLAPELKGRTAARDIINGIRLDNDDKYNEFQSSSDESDAVRVIAATDFITDADINEFLNNALATDASTDHGITRDMLLNRADAMSCGGCHKTTDNRDIAKGVKWPISAGPFGFVHISEGHTLSPALLEQFLPARKMVMADYICNAPKAKVNIWPAIEVLLD
ncbi:hypothetical protein EDC56_1233 [Sinobacterium caligoides]|uniref:Cytochrome c domain-containing protein n=1 Tax=Sinobacterium caligoides TaxID=933926 RepID=A0A3N2E0R2_9GAMM|nr:hypothetical protein [Sinobacterium caligoides]ROS05686.1 hypothetical protein EDC56_1233 [Sinobacterium caligoides]